MNIRDLIEAKARRTATLPITVGDLAAAVAEVNARRAALARHRFEVAQQPAQPAVPDVSTTAVHQPAPVDEHEQQLQAELDAAIAARNACVVYVKLQAIPDDQWDAALDALPIGEDGGPDISSIRAALMAASCVDEDLRDEAWWAQQFAQPHWSKGELTGINMALLHLNLATPSADAGKG